MFAEYIYSEFHIINYSVMHVNGNGIILVIILHYRTYAYAFRQLIINYSNYSRIKIPD